jgi:hypothetical protein
VWRVISREAGGASLPKAPLHYESVPSRIHNIMIWACVRSKGNLHECYPLRRVEAFVCEVLCEVLPHTHTLPERVV